MKPNSQSSVPSMRFQEQWVTVDSVRMHAQVAPAKCAQPMRPFVFVPGLGMSHRYFVPLATQLASHADVYLLDLPGHGRSASGSRLTRIEQLSDVLHAWLEAAGLEQAVLVGNSLGAQIAVDYALRYSRRVRGLALLGATFDPRARSLLPLAKRVLRTGLHEKATLYPLLVGDYLKALPRLLAEYRVMVADQIEQKLPQLGVPVLHVQGERDFISPADWTRQLCDKTSQGQMVTIAGAAHAPHFSKPAEVAAALVNFFAAPSAFLWPHRAEAEATLLTTGSDC